ncbi:MAG: FAD-dependent oxidoreductase, partial [Planctomycetota bacterium]
IKSVKCWQLTTYTWHKIEADLFADCSGDSVLAPLTGAETCTGREASAEFDEDIEPEKADDKTMGMSLLMQPQEEREANTFRPFPWANTYPDKDSINNRLFDTFNSEWQNFWWIELGGTRDTIKETENIRDDLLKVTLGVWDHIKNQVDYKGDNWGLNFMGFLPGKRESLRYVGDHMLCQNEVRAEGKFDDLIAYGGWPMDDHHPDGFEYPGKPTIFHPAPSPFGIPYRSLYSKNISNLLFAGRNISVTHAAMSSTRVMATCAILGQAAGTAAALAAKNNTNPRGVYKNHIKELQQTLMDDDADDAYLPWHKREISELSKTAELTSSEGEAENLRNGLGREIGDADNSCTVSKNGAIEYSFAEEKQVTTARIVFDSDLQGRTLNMRANYPLDREEIKVPETLVKSFRIEIKQNGEWTKFYSEPENFQRLKKIPIQMKAEGIRLVPEDTWGAEMCRVFEFDVV